MRRERGAGLVAGLAGLLVVLVLLLFSVEVLAGLYAGTALTAVTHDAARQVAGDERVRTGDAVGAAVADADRRLRRGLGRVGRNADVAWSVDPDAVTVQVRIDRPGVLPPGWRAAGLREPIERTVRVRVERLR